MSHLDEGILHALVDGEIPSAELAPVQAHLAACAECRARLDEARGLAGEALALVESLGDGAPSIPASPPAGSLSVGSRTTLYRQLAWAATVVIAAGLGYAARGPGGIPALQPPAITLQAPSAGTAPSPPAAPAESAAQEALPPVPRATRPAPPPAAAPALRDTTAAAMNLAAEMKVRPEMEAARDRAVAEPVPQRPAAPLALGRAESRLTGGTAGQAAPMALQSAADRLEVAVESFTPIGFPEAVARLGGTLRLVDGMIPDRLEASATTVRVIYPLQSGELVLEQRRVGDSVRVVLRGPLSADSLAVLRARVRE